MYHNVKVMVSDRHVHLTKEIYDKLFDHELTKRNDLNQLGQFAANETVDLVNGDNVIEHVRIIGPYRTYNQVEISKTDAYKLKLNPPVRSSGDIKNSEAITIRTSKATVILNEGCILANRHIHFNKSDAEKYKVKNDDKLKVHILGEKRGTIEAFAKVSDDGYFELHLDRDDANAFLLENEQELVMEVNNNN